MKKITKEIKKWQSGISPTSNFSYEKYLKIGLEMMNPHLSVRSYKLAPKEEYPAFQRGKDIRICVFWKNKPAIDVNGRKYEVIVEIPFWMKSNSNKEDRVWMRNHADCHLKCFYDAIERGKEKHKNEMSKKTTKKTTKKKTKLKVGSTQKAFDEMKKSKK